MTRRRTVLLILATSLYAACGGGEAPDQELESEPQQAVLTAGNLGEQAVIAASEYLAEPPYANADRRNGATQAQVCRACHSLEKGGAALLGPNLHGIFGKRAGSSDGFAYSEALTAAGFVWTPRALDAWLAQPARFLPGNRMSFAGVLREADRNDLIAYLLEVTDNNSDE